MTDSGIRRSTDSDEYVTEDHPSLQPDEIEPGLFLSGVFTEGVLGVLQKHGITHVLQVAVPDIEVMPHHVGILTYENLVLIDRSDQDLVSHLPQGLSFIDRCLQTAGGKVLVHCVHGQSRSAAVVIAYLMWKHAWDYTTALELVRARRPRVRPNDGFAYQLSMLHQAGFDLGTWPGWDDRVLRVVHEQAMQQQATGVQGPLHHPCRLPSPLPAAAVCGDADGAAAGDAAAAGNGAAAGKGAAVGTPSGAQQHPAPEKKEKQPGCANLPSCCVM